MYIFFQLIDNMSIILPNNNSRKILYNLTHVSFRTTHIISLNPPLGQYMDTIYIIRGYIFQRINTQTYRNCNKFYTFNDSNASFAMQLFARKIEVITLTYDYNSTSAMKEND